MPAQEDHGPLPLRPHTILGVCEGIGEDFGFNPIWLRVPLAASVLFSPTMAIAAYFALGAVVLIARLLFPKPKTADAAASETAGTVHGAAANEQREIAEAA